MNKLFEIKIEKYKNNEIINVIGGLIEEYCFTRYIANSSKKYFNKQIKKLIILDNLIDPIHGIYNTFNYIFNSISKLKKNTHCSICNNMDFNCSCVNNIIYNNEKECIFGYGNYSLPYLIELTNLIYLPNLINCYFISLNILLASLQYINNHIKCFAIICYDNINKCIYGKIILLELPSQYIDILKIYNINDIIITNNITNSNIKLLYRNNHNNHTNHNNFYQNDIFIEYENETEYSEIIKLLKIDKKSVLLKYNNYSLRNIINHNNYNIIYLYGTLDNLHKIPYYLYMFINNNKHKNKKYMINSLDISYPQYEFLYNYIPLFIINDNVNINIDFNNNDIIKNTINNKSSNVINENINETLKDIIKLNNKNTIVIEYYKLLYILQYKTDNNILLES